MKDEAPSLAGTMYATPSKAVPTSPMQMNDKLIIEYTDPLCLDVERVGAKAAYVARIANRYPQHTPRGFAINFRSLDDLWGDTSSANVLSAHKQAISDALSFHLRGRIVNSVYYAVRSSAAIEDGPLHSFAGQFETVLGVLGLDNITAAIFQCLRSYTDKRPTIYRKVAGIDKLGYFSVLIQELVIASRSGVLFTYDPVSRTDDVIINASYGLGNMIVDGAVIPDTLRIDRNTRHIAYDIGTKALMSVMTPNGISILDVPDSHRGKQAISDMDVVLLTDLGLSLEADMGVPLDIEWAISPAGTFLLQMRPITALQSRSNGDG